MVARRLSPTGLVQLVRTVRRTGVWAEIRQLLRNRSLAIGTSTTAEKNPSPPALFQMATAYWLSQAIYVAAKLGIADLLKDGPLSCGTLANSTGSDASSLFRLIVPDAGSASFSKLLDLNMLVMNGGRERTVAEFSALLAAADCRLTRIVPTMAPQSVVESVPKARRPA